jgi:hypothetical protein
LRTGGGGGVSSLPHSNPKNKTGGTLKIFKKKCKGVPLKYEITSPKNKNYDIINLGGTCNESKRIIDTRIGYEIK